MLASDGTFCFRGNLNGDLGPIRYLPSFFWILERHWKVVFEDLIDTTTKGSQDLLTSGSIQWQTAVRIPLPTTRSPNAHLSAVNEIRAMRISELISDFRAIQTYIAAIRTRPSAEAYHEEGYVLLRRCVTEAQALLAQPFQAAPTGKGDEEGNCLLLRR